MISVQELVWLHTLQNSLANKRDWVAVAHLQALIDHIAEKHLEHKKVMSSPGLRNYIH